MVLLSSTRPGSLLVLIATATTVTLGATTIGSAATNVIEVDRSINGVGIGNRAWYVVKKVGAPRRVTTGYDEFGRYRTLRFPDRFTVTITSSRGAVVVSTRSREVRTVDGIGVGSTRAQLRSAYEVSCRRMPGEPGKQTCETRPPDFDEASTVFRLTDRVVRSVELVTLME